MAADRSRFDVEGISIQGSLLTARPVGTLVRDTITGDLYVSGHATVPTYTVLAGSLGSQTLIADPGTGAAIPVTESGYVPIVTAGAETNTLAIPTFIGQTLLLFCDTYAIGDRVITASAAFNVANNTIMTFGVVSDACELIGVSVGGALVWQMTWNDGVALS